MSNWFTKHIYDAGGGAAASPAPAVGAAPPATGLFSAPPVLASGPVAAGAVNFGIDPSMVADIKKIIARHPTPFTNLRETAETLAEALPDEASRLRAAFAMLKKSGTAPAQVVSAIDLHIRDINAEKDSFNLASQQAVDRRAGALRNEAEQLILANKAGEADIASLTQQIQQLQQRSLERAGQAAQKQNEASAAEVEIQGKTAQFLAAADSVIAELNMQKSQLSAMLN